MEVGHVKDVPQLGVADGLRKRHSRPRHMACLRVGSSMRNWSKLIFVNVLVAILLLSLAEIAARLVWTAKACLRGACDASMFRNLTVADAEISRNYGFSRFDESLGGGHFGHGGAPGN